MKTINETFTDAEHKLLLKKKDGFSWHDFILLSLKVLKGGRENGNNNDKRNRG